MIDSQSVEADAVVGADSGGFDSGKPVNGRKRHVVFDTLGLLLGVMVTAADTGDHSAAHVLPLAIKPLTGQFQEAACTLLLNEITESSFGMQAVFLNDALITLDITDPDALARLRPRLQSTVELLTGVNGVRSIWDDFVDILITELSIKSSDMHARAPLTGLKNLRARSQVAGDQLVPGLTCHQAKGKEWGTVGVRLEENDAAALYNGLVPENEEHRCLYVALTRARRLTIAL